MSGNPNTTPRLPLAGIRVVDFTRVLSGPFCTALLADLGAEVIKVEPPGGDEYRHVGPFRDGESALFTLVNRNKRSVVADLKDTAQRDAVRRLCESADVVVENFKPGVASRLGIGYEAVARDNPAVVYASISGFGQDGADRERPAFDLVVQAMSGLMDVTGEADGPPTRVGESVADLAAGLYASWAILAALFDRERSGRGAYLDVAMLDCLFSLLPTSVAQWMFTGSAPARVGNRHPISTPFGAFAAGDGHVVIAVLNGRQFGALCECMGRSDLAGDPRFECDAARTENEPVLRGIIEDWLLSLTVAEAVERLAAAGVPASPIATMDEAITRARGSTRRMLREHDHPRLGATPVMVQPVQCALWPDDPPRPAPALGEYTDAAFAGRWHLNGNDDV